MSSSPGTSRPGIRCPMACGRQAACWRSAARAARRRLSSRQLAVVDQIVVSVGPYMLSSVAGTSARSSLRELSGSASPPTISTAQARQARRGRPRPRAASTPATACTAGASRRVCAICSATERAAPHGARLARDARISCVQVLQVRQHRVGVDAEVDQAGDLVDARCP